MFGPLQHATLFLETLHAAGGLIEITALAPRHRPIKRYFTDPAVAAEWGLETNWQGYGVFAGVNPRNQFDGHEHSVAASVALFLDFDPGKHDVDAGLKLLAAQGILPSITVCSGNGAHAYFLLSCPIETATAKPVAARLCKATVSDCVGNVNRIARLAGSVNWKNDAPKWAHLTGIWPDRRYTIEQITYALDKAGAPRVFATPPCAPRQPQNPTDDIKELLVRLPPHPHEIVHAGERNIYSAGQVSRSEADFFVVCALVRADATDDQIQWIYDNMPIGELKYNQPGAGQRYLNRTIEKARQATAEVPRREFGSRKSVDSHHARGSRGGAREERGHRHDRF